MNKGEGRNLYGTTPRHRALDDFSPRLSLRDE